MNTAIQKRPKIDIEELKRLDEVVNTSALSIAKSAGTFVEAVIMADSIQNLRDSITPEMMVLFTGLMNTSLGFKTDRDPNVKRTNKPDAIPYSNEVVKECVIEAILRGVKIAGNHFNILAGRTYITKEGYQHLIKKVEGLQDFSPLIGVPRKVDVGTVVNCKAKWTISGKQFSIGYDNDPIVIPVKIDEYTTNDAIIGKATRKFLKIAYERITGIQTPDGEVGDDIITPTVDVKTVKTDAPIEPKTDKSEKTASADYPASVRLLTKNAKLNEEQVLAFLKTVKRIPLTVETIDDIPSAILADVVANWETLSPEIRLMEV